MKPKHSTNSGSPDLIVSLIAVRCAGVEFSNRTAIILLWPRDSRHELNTHRPTLCPAILRDWSE